jgi:hypothetical protein
MAVLGLREPMLSPMCALTAYAGSPEGEARRSRDSIFGMDARLIALTGEGTPLGAEDEALVRRACWRWRQALARVREEISAPGADPARVTDIATQALSTLPEDDGAEEHLSVRACRWMARDRFTDLARILDAAASGGDVLEVARSRVARAYARVELR